MCPVRDKKASAQFIESNEKNERQGSLDVIKIKMFLIE